MKLKFLLVLSIMAFVLYSCSKDDGPKEEANNPPSISDKTVSVSEAITPGTTVETLTATDADDNTLTFSITGNPGPFTISTDGVLTLASGQTLDFDVTNSYSITVSVTDGTDSATATITINVTEVVPTNQAPEIADQGFEASEDSQDGVALYTLENVSDPDGDPITFDISVNDNGLFAINDDGEISLAEGQNLDYETTTSHQITVNVSDGTESSTAAITINVTNVNEAPEIADQGFEASEDSQDGVALYTLENVSDPDGDPLTFEISVNDNGLFTINDDGEISLAEGQSLDYETATSHQITISVSDGTNATEAVMTITVTNVIETLLEDPDSFIITFETTQANEEIQVGTDANLSYDYTIDWGDGTIEQKNTSTPPAHHYINAGEHTIAIKGNSFPRILMLNNPSANKLISIDQWGNNVWSNFANAFWNCTNLAHHNATDAPDLSNVTDLSAMFYGATSFNGNLNNWTLTTIKQTGSMFYNAIAFNGDISEWDVSNVWNMSSMFYNATAFNGDISGWQTGSALNMTWMFREAENFDQDLGGWNIGSVTNMANMLDGSGLSTENYNATLIGWASQNSIPQNILLGANGRTYCGTEAVTARNALLANGWDIQGDAECVP